MTTMTINPLKSERFYCMACGFAGPAFLGPCSEYAILAKSRGNLKEGDKICRTCSGKFETETLADPNVTRFVGYLSSDGKSLSTWDGTILGRASKGAQHPWSRERFYVRVTDVHGGKWHGTAAPGMWASLRRVKA